MEKKTIVSTLYLKDGAAVNGFRDFTSAGNLYSKVRLYNDSGIDKIIIYDLSEDDKEHEKNIQTIKKLAQNIEIPICAGGNINRLEDIKKILYAGCKQVVLNASKPETAQLADEGSKRFGKEIVVRNGEPREGVFSADCEWGYFSEKDGERHHFDLCESCYDDLVSSFKIPVDAE